MNIQGILEDKGFDCFSYSGRGMGGRQCLAVSISDVAFGLVEIGWILGRNGEDKPDIVQYDNLGMDYVVYFPGVEYQDETDEDEESENE